jgi:hypothetical protein
MAKKHAPQTVWEPNSLFRGDMATAHLNACVGLNGGPYDLTTYARGFFLGGQVIIETAGQSRTPVDAVVYPAAFTFRHGIELYLKYLLKELIAYNGSAVQYNKNHTIWNYWLLVTAEIRKTGKRDFDRDDIDLAQPIIKDFCEIDPTGQVFRYPEDLQGNQHLLGLNLINMVLLGEGMAQLHTILEGWHNRIDDLRDRRRKYRD